MSGERLLYTPLTRVGAVVGTPNYIAPEQFLSLPADPRTDQFSFAATLFEILSGKTAFQGGSIKQLRTHILQGKIRQAPAGSIPPWILKIIQRGLAIAPSDRYPSMEALLADLENDPARVRQRRLAALGIVCLVALAGLGVWSTWQRLFAGEGICQGAEAKLAGIWDEPARSQVQQGFLRTGVPYALASFQAVERTFSAYAAQWTGMYRDSCEATRVRGEQSEELLDLRMGCLSERRAEWSSLVQLFLRPDRDTLVKGLMALNHRKRALVSHALRHPHQIYTIQSQRISHNVVYQTARADLLDLVERGLLSLTKKGKAMRFHPVADLEKRVRKLR